MLNPEFEIQLIAVLVAMACAVPGVFLVLRRMSMVTDAITHTILLGIVIGFFIVKDLNSPVLILGATIIGVMTVWVSELLSDTRLMVEESAIGIVYPLFFSIAVILISRYAGSAHLDTDSVLLGELAFAPFNRYTVNGVDIGAKGLYTSGFLLLLNLIFVGVFFKELKLVIFDPALATIIGFSPAIIHYALMSVVSVTIVGSFEAVGSVLVIAFMIGPPATAYLLTNDLKRMILYSMAIGSFSGIIGFRLAMFLDVSIPGSMAVVVGFVFMLAVLFAPKRGLVSTLLLRAKQRKTYHQLALLWHVYQHEHTDRANVENHISTIAKHLNWEQSKIDRIVASLVQDSKLQVRDGMLYNMLDASELEAFLFEE